MDLRTLGVFEFIDIIPIDAPKILLFAAEEICSVSKASLIFSIKSYFRIILHTFWVRPGITHFSQKVLVLFSKKV